MLNSQGGFARYLLLKYINISTLLNGLLPLKAELLVSVFMGLCNVHGGHEGYGRAAKILMITVQLCLGATCYEYTP